MRRRRERFFLHGFCPIQEAAAGTKRVRKKTDRIFHCTHGATEMKLAQNNEQKALVLGCGIAVAIILSAVFAGVIDKAPTQHTVYENVLEEKKILAQIRIHLLKSVDMEKSAVMALTDQASTEFADQSRSASASVDQHLAELRSLVNAMPLPHEKQLIDEFASCWAELGKVDRVILELAAENTNLKALALSKEKGAEIMQRFEQILGTVRTLSSGTAHERRAIELTSQAMIAGLKAYNLHGPHIIEADDKRMDHYEQRMREHEEEVEHALNTLHDLVDAEQRNVVSQAKTVFAEFTALTAHIVRLSRQNSNIRSLELSLGRKRVIAARCDETLAVLQDTVQNKTVKATK
jgi:hypothetical protein